MKMFAGGEGWCLVGGLELFQKRGAWQEWSGKKCRGGTVTPEETTLLDL